MNTGPDWGQIGRMAVFTSLLGAVLTYFLLPGDRWISLVLLGVAFFDGVAFTVLLPRLTGSRWAQSSRLDRMNAEAEAAAKADDEWALDAEEGSDPKRNPDSG